MSVPKKACIITIPLIILCIVCIFVLRIKFDNKKTSYLNLHPAITKMLEQENLMNCHIISLGDFSDVQYKMEIATVTDEEVEQKVQSLLDEFDIPSLDDADLLWECYGVNSKEELYNYARNSLEFNIKENARLKKNYEVEKLLISKCQYNLNKEEVANFAVNAVNGYKESADMFGMSLEDFCTKQLEIDYEDFYDYCYDESEQYVKTYLLVGALGYKEYFNYSFDSDDIYEQYSVMHNKIIDSYVK